ncbi:hypothetical protein GUJ93_ZPchr0013g37493 [Zizania palustris]|uniref:PI31 proteasome regulator N-terminal domain-containing protein n=1 Tax=Zizania palustris TaxID=103762 RepID=A0A8J6BZ66_ZIZPA|nr:hypothetical protein GUJ93_ZPchr0013g37493 [Zizania palustris]
MDVVKAARPAFRGAHDGVAFAANAAFLAAGYSLCAVGLAALTDPPPSGEEEVRIDGLNNMENCYAFLYVKEEKGKNKRLLVKCLVISNILAIDVLDLESQDKGPYNIQIMFICWDLNLVPCLVETMNSNVLCKLDEKDAGAAKNPKVETSSSINRYESRVLRMVLVRVADWQHACPNDPHFPSNPFPAHFGGPGSVPLGSRYDPIGPPDIPWFEHSRVVRRPRPLGGSTHPDLEFLHTALCE